MTDLFIVIVGLVTEVLGFLILGELYSIGRTLTSMKQTLMSMKQQEKQYWETWRKAKEAEKQ